MAGLPKFEGILLEEEEFCFILKCMGTLEFVLIGEAYSRKRKQNSFLERLGELRSVSLSFARGLLFQRPRRILMKSRCFHCIFAGKGRTA